MRDALFAGGVLVLSALVLGWLLSAPPFGEAGSAAGALWGWGISCAAVIPSYVLLSRAVADDNPHRFQRAFMLGTAGRFGLYLSGAVLFWIATPERPVKIFVLALGLGWLLLTGLELGLVLKPRREDDARSVGATPALNEDHA